MIAIDFEKAFGSVGHDFLSKIPHSFVSDLLSGIREISTKYHVKRFANGRNDLTTTFSVAWSKCIAVHFFSETSCFRPFSEDSISCTALASVTECNQLSHFYSCRQLPCPAHA